VVGAPLSARDEILGRVRDALADVPAGERPEDVDVPRGYLRQEPGDPIALFVERVAEYRTTVLRVPVAALPDALAARCRERGVRRLAVPADLPAAWRVEGVEILADDELDVAGLDGADGALTGCALAIAETGTIVLDGGARQGRRLLTLVPDYHLCVVEEAQVVGGVPEAMEAVAAAVRGGRRPVTFVSGPSATSDIELARVEGVHGPRTLDVLVVGR
jgi:L-lactate dehydrogenase complex protein LldG